jgi:hypothetical protein
MKTIAQDGSDDTVIPDYMLNITTQPANASGNSTNNDITNISVVAASVPSGATITYQWQLWGGSSFANVSGGSYSNSTTATLSILANTSPSLNGKIYRVQVGATGAANVNSGNAVLTITS